MHSAPHSLVRMPRQPAVPVVEVGDRANFRSVEPRRETRRIGDAVDERRLFALKRLDHELRAAITRRIGASAERLQEFLFGFALRPAIWDVSRASQATARRDRNTRDCVRRVYPDRRDERRAATNSRTPVQAREGPQPRCGIVIADSMKVSTSVWQANAARLASCLESHRTCLRRDAHLHRGALRYMNRRYCFLA